MFRKVILTAIMATAATSANADLFGEFGIQHHTESELSGIATVGFYNDRGWTKLEIDGNDKGFRGEWNTKLWMGSGSYLKSSLGLVNTDPYENVSGDILSASVGFGKEKHWEDGSFFGGSLNMVALEGTANYKGRWFDPEVSTSGQGFSLDVEGAKFITDNFAISGEAAFTYVNELTVLSAEANATYWLGNIALSAGYTYDNVELFGIQDNVSGVKGKVTYQF